MADCAVYDATACGLQSSTFHPLTPPRTLSLAVSDANTFLIEAILEAYGMADAFAAVHTNPGYFEDATGCLRVHPYHSESVEPHGCAHCPVNMCKGESFAGPGLVWSGRRLSSPHCFLSSPPPPLCVFV